MPASSIWLQAPQTGAVVDPCPVGLRGIVPSLNTPFDTDGGVDLISLRRAVDHCVDCGTAGLLILAVASESASLTADEITTVADTILDQAAGRIPVVVSVTDDTQSARIARARHAAAMGAPAILCQPPPGDDATARRDMLAEIADAGPDLFMLQDLDWAGPGLPMDEIVTLFEAIPQFASLKVEVAPAGPKYSAVLAATEGRLHVCGGWAVQQMVDALRRGAHAFMPTAMEQIYVAIYRLFQTGDEAAARRLHGELLPVLAFCNQHITTSIRFFKRQRVAEGVFATGVCRPSVPAFDDMFDHESALMIDHVSTMIDRLSRD